MRGTMQGAMLRAKAEQEEKDAAAKAGAARERAREADAAAAAANDALRAFKAIDAERERQADLAIQAYAKEKEARAAERARREQVRAAEKEKRRQAMVRRQLVMP
jgi:Trichohyalin-plectin-homology domain